jgi:hypothetical protein
MFNTALFILTQPVNHIRKCLPLYMKEINKLASKTAYIHIQPGILLNAADQNNENSILSSKTCDSHFELLRVPFTDEIRNLVKEFYVSNANICSNLDVRVLVGHIGSSELKFQKYDFKHQCDVVLIDLKHEQGVNNSVLLNSLNRSFNISASCSCQSLDVRDNEGTPKRQKTDDSNTEEVRSLIITCIYNGRGHS